MVGIRHTRELAFFGGVLDSVAYVESVHSSRRRGLAMFTFGQNFGEWLGIFAALDIRVELVAAAVATQIPGCR